MPPKNKFTKEQIVEVAFDIAKVEGIDQITIRKVAQQLGSSIAPIYVNFEDIEELKKAVMSKINEISHSMILQQETKDIFLNIGVASVKFAKEYRVIFRELMLKNNTYMEHYNEELGHTIISLMKTDPELESFSDEELKIILLKMRIFQVGLSIMSTNESFSNELTDDQVIELLKSTGSDIISGMKSSKNNEGDF